MKILTCDLETQPNIAHLWSLWGEQNVGLPQLQQSAEVMCWAAKWAHEKRPRFMDKRGGREQMLRGIYDLYSEADIVVTYNGDKFDHPWLNGEWARLGWNPPPPYVSVDLYKVVKARFKYPSLKLAYVSEALLGDTKAATGGHELWVQCMADNPQAWARMRKYNIQDVLLTERLFERLKPWIPALPIHQLYHPAGDQHACPQCGSTKLTHEGRAYTRLAAYQRYRCCDCGRWSRDARRLEGAALR